MASQFSNELEHVVFLHNDVIGQRLIWYTSVAPVGGAKYTIFGNCVSKTIEWVPFGQSAPDLVATDMHIDGDSVVPAVVTNLTKGGNITSLFVDVDSGDFTRAGDLLVNLRAPRMRYDRTRKIRAPMDSVGALAKSNDLDF